MKTNLQFIKFFSVFSLAALLIGYIFNVFSFETQWLDSTFLDTIFTGIFASFLVVLITEIKKYFVNRRAAEDTMYSCCNGLYVELTRQIATIDMYLKDKTATVPQNLLECRIPIISNCVNTLQFLDYSTARKKNSLTLRFKDFILEDLYNLTKHINACRYLEIAINETQILYLQSGTAGHNPTSSDSLVNTALQKIKASAEARRAEVAGFMETLHTTYPDRFGWKENKANIDKLSFDTQEMDIDSKNFFEN